MTAVPEHQCRAFAAPKEGGPPGGGPGGDKKGPPPGLHGKVDSTTATTIVVTDREGNSSTITVDSSTKYTLDGKDATLADVKPASSSTPCRKREPRPRSTFTPGRRSAVRVAVGQALADPMAVARAAAPAVADRVVAAPAEKVRAARRTDLPRKSRLWTPRHGQQSVTRLLFALRWG